LSHPRCLYHRTSHHPPRATHFPTRRSSDLFDARKAVKEQVESLGARFVEVPSDEDAQTAGGYAKETSAAYQERQRALIAERLAKCDACITTAQIPGKRAPILITAEMVRGMKRGAVIVDL